MNGGRRALRDVPVSQVELVVKVNLLGILLCTKVAMDIMADQVSFSLVPFFELLFTVTLIAAFSLAHHRQE